VGIDEDGDQAAAHFAPLCEEFRRMSVDEFRQAAFGGEPTERRLDKRLN
jgi:hypothetical protein